MHVKRITAVITALIFATMTAAFTSVAQSSAATNPSWKIQFSTSFSTAARLGSFSGCSNWGADICTGLPECPAIVLVGLSGWLARYRDGAQPSGGRLLRATEYRLDLGWSDAHQDVPGYWLGVLGRRGPRKHRSTNGMADTPKLSASPKLPPGTSPRISCGRTTAAVSSKSTSRRTIGTRAPSAYITTAVPASFHSRRTLTGRNGTPTRLSGGLVTSACTLTARSSARQLFNVRAQCQYGLDHPE